MIVVLALTVAAMLASLALPWVKVAVPSTTVDVMTSTGSVQQVATRGGTVRYLGRDVGALGPLLVLTGLAVGVAFAALKRWWWAIAGGAVMMLKSGISAPSVSGLSRGPATVSLAAADTGMNAVRVLYALYVFVIALTAIQTYIVWRAEKDWGATGAKLAAALRSLRSKVDPKG